MNQQQLLIPIAQIQPDLRTGDLVLMHGVDQSSQAIQFLTNSIFSHVAMVVLPADIGLTLPDSPVLLWESTPMNTVNDVELHFGKAGPTLVPMVARIQDDVARDYDSMFAVRHLHGTLTPAMLNSLASFIAQHHAATFPGDNDLVQDWIAGRVAQQNPNPTFSTFFCSELVAMTMQTIGLLPANMTPNWFAPADFSTDRDLPWLLRATLGPELYLDPGHPSAAAPK